MSARLERLAARRAALREAIGANRAQLAVQCAPWCTLAGRIERLLRHPAAGAAGLLLGLAGATWPRAGRWLALLRRLWQVWGRLQAGRRQAQ